MKRNFNCARERIWNAVKKRSWQIRFIFTPHQLYLPPYLLVYKHHHSSHFWVTLSCFSSQHQIHPDLQLHVKTYQRKIQFLQNGNRKVWTDLRRESAHQEVGLGEEVDVKDDSSERVLGVAVVEACRPWDGVVANELVVWVPESDVNRNVNKIPKHAVTHTHQLDTNTHS